MLEMANYLPSPRLVPSSYRLGIYELPDDTPMDRWPVSVLPPDWRDFPYPISTRRMGTNWLIQGNGHLLAVPSAAVPAGLETILLASPARLGAETIRLDEGTPTFDLRIPPRQTRGRRRDTYLRQGSRRRGGQKGHLPLRGQ